MARWSDEEINILEKCYAESKEPLKDANQKIKGRSKEAIRKKAYSLGILDRSTYIARDKTNMSLAEHWELCNKVLNKAKELCGKPLTDPTRNPYKGDKEE